MTTAETRLVNAIESVVPETRMEIHRTIDSLSDRLHQCRYDSATAVLLATSTQDLFELLSIRDLIQKARVILILPDREKTTIANGHALYPRFLSYVDSDFKDVAAVLKKMIGVINSKNNKHKTQRR